MRKEKQIKEEQRMVKIEKGERREDWEEKN